MSAGAQIDYDALAQKHGAVIDYDSLASQHGGASDSAESGPSTYDRLTRGYNPDVEEYARNHPVLGPVVRFLDSAGGAAISTPEGLYNMLRHPGDSASGLIDSIKAWGDPAVRQGALSVLPEALGQGVGNAAAGEAIGSGVSKGAGSIPLKNVKGNIGELTRNPDTNQPRLPIKIGTAVTKLVGGPELADALLPDNPTFVRNQAHQAFAEQLAEVEKTRLKELADLEKLREQDARSRMLRGTQQDRIDKASDANAPRPNPFGDATSSASPSLSPVPLPSPSGQAIVPQFVSKFAPPEPSMIQAPGSPPPAINKTLVSYPRVTLASMARAGDVNALTELIRNPGGINISEAVPNSKFLMEQGRPTNIYGGPKSVTKFSTEGVPLSEMAPGKPEWAYRVRSVGEEGISVGKKGLPHATTTLEDADRIAPGREDVTGEPQEKVKFDLSKYKEGVDYVRHHREGQPDWIEMLRSVPESSLRKVKTQ